MAPLETPGLRFHSTQLTLGIHWNLWIMGIMGSIPMLILSRFGPIGPSDASKIVGGLEFSVNIEASDR